MQSIRVYTYVHKWVYNLGCRSHRDRVTRRGPVLQLIHVLFRRGPRGRCGYSGLGLAFGRFSRIPRRYAVPTHVVWHVLLSAHVCRVLIGACNCDVLPVPPLQAPKRAQYRPASVRPSSFIFGGLILVSLVPPWPDPGPSASPRSRAAPTSCPSPSPSPSPSLSPSPSSSSAFHRHRHQYTNTVISPSPSSSPSPSPSLSPSPSPSSSSSFHRHRHQYTNTVTIPITITITITITIGAIATSWYTAPIMPVFCIPP